MRGVVIAGTLTIVSACAGHQSQDCFADAITQADMDRCALVQMRGAEAQLDASYRKLMIKSDGGGGEALKAAKTAWEAYREKQCEFNVLSAVGGSVHSMVLSQCYAAMAQDYTKILEDQLNCEEGDLSCGAW